ncbi:hypothetical protein H920_04843 [Fukomys damarensis]|uniref:Uncharacterized protein n=1 Tax=Fukomys damarensis TaxID=885580 RepID=A0A091DNY8_FUKDA|nr:hypothetical protein H920_04843 [Fukomys damarensis]
MQTSKASYKTENRKRTRGTMDGGECDLALAGAGRDAEQGWPGEPELEVVGIADGQAAGAMRVLVALAGDLMLCNLWLFLNVKMTMKGERSDSTEGIEAGRTAHLKTLVE